MRCTQAALGAAWQTCCAGSWMKSGHVAPGQVLHARCHAEGVAHLVASLRQRLDLPPPLLPEGTKAVHQQEGWTILPRGGGLCSTATGSGPSLFCSGKEQNERSCCGQAVRLCNGKRKLLLEQVTRQWTGTMG